MNQETKDIDKEWSLLVQKHATVLVHKHEDWGQLNAKHSGFNAKDEDPIPKLFYYGFLITGGGFATWDGENFFCDNCYKQAPNNVKYVALLAFVKKCNRNNLTYRQQDRQYIPFVPPSEKDNTIIIEYDY